MTNPPCKDLVLIGVATLVGATCINVAASGDLAATAAGGLVGGVWFFLGVLYGYGEAMDI